MPLPREEVLERWPDACICCDVYGRKVIIAGLKKTAMPNVGEASVILGIGDNADRAWANAAARMKEK
jgi:hypothetical protein